MEIEKGMSVEEFLAIRQMTSGNDVRLTLVLTSILAGCRLVHRAVNEAGLAGVLGSTGSTNVQGEEVQRLDVLARNTLVKHVEHCGPVAGIATEEDEEIIPASPDGMFLVNTDPLDGSSNIDANVNIGTIFSVLRRPEPIQDFNAEAFLQAGRRQVAAGYVIYGPQTMLVLTLGNGVYGFTFQPGSGSFLLSHPDIHYPDKTRYYSVNEGNWGRWDESIRRIVSVFKGKYSARYIGSLVADFHRNLLTGGIFIYPADHKNVSGKLRYLYEVAPMAFIAEQAGGRAIIGSASALDHQPTRLHERVPFFVGNASDIAIIESELTI